MERQTGWMRVATAENAAPGAPTGPETAGPETIEAEALPLRTFIEGGAEFDGALRIASSLRIDGEFRGAIESGGTVTIGETAGVEADIRAREVVICGAVVGNVVATRQLVLRKGARLHGDVETPCLEIEKHAFFNGRTIMVRPEAALRANASASVSSSAPRPVPAPRASV